MSESGYLLFDKPARATSFAALGSIRKVFPSSKIGHTGTLDSFATGLLVVMVGSYSRLSPWFLGLDKEYLAEFQFGRGTDTLDPEGREDGLGPLPGFAILAAACEGFKGTIEQLPPRFSALHVQGHRASDLAIRGQEFSLSPRPVSIFALDLLSYDNENGIGAFRIHCSSGTYVRALARDIAQACSTFAHVISLRRTRVGPFSVDKAIDKSFLASSVPALRYLDPQIARSIGLGVQTLLPAQIKAFGNGLPSLLSQLSANVEPGKDSAIFTPEGILLGVLHNKGGQLAYGPVLKGHEEAKL